MHDVIVKMKDGKTLVGPLWDWRPEEGYFTLGGDSSARVQLEEVESAVERDAREHADEPPGDADLLERAREQGWASRADLLALVAKMRVVQGQTYAIFFMAGMGSHAHAFLEFNGLIAKYVDICAKCAEQGIDFRYMNTHSGRALPVEPYDMEYLGEKLDCIFGPIIGSNRQARAALMHALFGKSEPAPEEEQK